MSQMVVPQMESNQAIQTPRSGVSETLTFPQLESRGPQVNAKNHKSPGSAKWETLGYVLYGGFLLVLTIVSMGTILLVAGIGALIAYFFRKRFWAMLKGSAVKIGRDQLGEMHSCAQGFAARLGLKELPEMFVYEADGSNAMAFKLFIKKAVLFTDDAVWGPIQSGKPDALRFVIAHELAHHALGHTNWFRGAVRQVIRPLSRYDELSADAVAMQLVGSREAAYSGIIYLTVGPQLLPYINQEALLRQASEVATDKNSRRAEASMTHPLLLRRLAALREVPLARI